MKVVSYLLPLIVICIFIDNSSAQPPNSWTQKANFGGGTRAYAVGFSIGSKGYIGTGVNSTLNPCRDFWEYDTIANTWTQKANFAGGTRVDAVGFSIGTKGYVGIGLGDSGYDYNDFWEYNPSTNVWTQKANFGGIPRDAGVGFNIGNRGYIGTGVNNSTGIVYSDFWKYNPSTNNWTQVANFAGGVRYWAVGFSIGGNGYIGTGSDGYILYNDFWAYDTITNTWSQKANFGGTARQIAVGFSIGNKGYIGTGVDFYYGYSSDFWEYSTLTNTWTQKANFGGGIRAGAVGFNIGNYGFIGTGEVTPTYYNDFWKYTPSVCTLPTAPINTTPPSNQNICAGQSTTLTASGNGTLGWYTAASGGIWLGGGSNFITPVLTSNITYFIQDSNSCGVNPSRTSITVTVNPLPSVTNSPLSQTICSGTSTTLVTLTSNVSGTTFSWTATATPGITGFQTSGTNTIPVQTISTLGTTQGTVTYAIIPTAAGCSGSVTNYIILVNPLPNPTISGPSPVCVGSTGNIYSTQAGMSGYIWAISSGGIITSGGGTNIITVTWNQVGSQTVSVNYNNIYGCSAQTLTVYNITVNPLPVPTINGLANVCVGSIGNVYITQTGMTNYIWTISSGGMITSGGGTGNNSVIVTWNTTGSQSVSVNYTNSFGCTAFSPTVYNITVNPLPVPTITGNTNLCVNSGNYTYTTEAGMQNYQWTISSGGIINYGSGTDQLTVSWIISGNQSVSVTYTSPIGCNPTSPTVLNVTVNPYPDPAGIIIGSSNVCPNENNVAYSVAPINNATTYVWALPTGASIASGAGTDSITVDFSSGAGSGVIYVWGNNFCGDGINSPPFYVTVDPLPGPAGTITGASDVCVGTSDVNYSVAVIPNATGYDWTVPSGVVITSGNNTNNITTDFTPSAVSGIITVEGTNQCGTGSVSPPYFVNVNPIPPTPVVTNIGDTLQSSSPTGNQWYFEGNIISGATSQEYIATHDGYYWDVVTINGCSSDTSNHKLIIVTGIDSHSSASINVYPVPNDGRFNVSITTVSEETFSISVYNTLGIKIYEETNVEVNGSLQKMIDLRPLPNGVYTLIFKNSQNQVVKKIVVNK